MRTLSPAGSFLRSRTQPHSWDMSGTPIASQNSRWVMSPLCPLHRLHDAVRFSMTFASTRLHLGMRCSTVRLDLDPQ